MMASVARATDSATSAARSVTSPCLSAQSTFKFLTPKKVRPSISSTSSIRMTGADHSMTSSRLVHLQVLDAKEGAAQSLEHLIYQNNGR